MQFFKRYGILFVTIFFANYLLPGLALVNPSRWPRCEGDLIFPLTLALCNGIVFPGLRLLGLVGSSFRFILATVTVNAIAYGLLKFVSLGIRIVNWHGYLAAVIVVSLCSLFLGFRDKRSWKDPQNPLGPSLHLPE